MIVWGNYPLLRFLPFFCISLLSPEFPPWICLLIHLGCCFGLLVFQPYVAYRYRFATGIFVATFAFGFGGMVKQIHQDIVQLKLLEVGQGYQLKGVVESVSSSGKSGIIQIKGSHPLQVYGFKTNLNSGDSITVCGEIKGQFPSFPWEFSYDNYLKGKGVFQKMKVREIVWHFQSSSASVSNPIDHLLRAMVKGEKQGLVQRDKEVFQKWGCAHLFAVSGFHVGFVYGLMVLLLRIFSNMPKKVKIFCHFMALCLVWAFVFWVGAPVSALRAGLMISLIGFSQMGGGELTPIRTVLWSIFILLCWNPLWVWDLGFWMSHIAVASIFLIFPLMEGKSDKPSLVQRIVWDPIKISIAVQLGLFPIITQFDNGFHPWVFLPQWGMTWIFPLLFIVGLCRLLILPNWGVTLENAMEYGYRWTMDKAISLTEGIGQPWIHGSWEIHEIGMFYMLLVLVLLFLNFKDVYFLKRVIWGAMVGGLMLVFPIRMDRTGVYHNARSSVLVVLQERLVEKDPKGRSIQWVGRTYQTFPLSSVDLPCTNLK